MSSLSTAREAWRLLFDLLMKTAPHRAAVLGRLGLTPNDARALASLSLEGKPMRALADEWGTDPSTVTWVVDRLEKLGLAKRTPSPTDRRTKLIVLTANGKRTKSEIDRAFYQPPSSLSALSERELQQLIALVSKIG